MTTVVIPTRSDLDYYVETVTLGGTGFRLGFAWNTRDERWYLDIEDSSGTTLIAGLAIVVDCPLTLRFPSLSLPKGLLLAMDTTGEGREIADKEDLGDRVQLVFIPSEDL